MEAVRYVMRARACELNMTADTSGLYFLTTSASRLVMRGLDCTFSHSSSLRTMPNCWTMNESAPASLRMARLTDAFRPWIRETTAIIDMTATMLPSTVMSDRSLAAQMALRAMPAASRYLFTVSLERAGPSRDPPHS